MKKDLWLKILIPCVIFGIYLLVVFTEPDLRPAISTNRFDRACSKAGYTLTDVTDEYRANFYSKALSDTHGNTEITYYRFTQDAYAKFVYSMYLTRLQTGVAGELYRASPDYSRFYYSGDRYITLLYRNNAEVIYLYAPASEAENINVLIDDLDL